MDEKSEKQTLSRKSYLYIMFLFDLQTGNLNDLATRRSSDGSPQVSPASWETFERRHNTQKRMPKLAYNQLKKGKMFTFGFLDFQFRLKLEKLKRL